MNARCTKQCVILKPQFFIDPMKLLPLQRFLPKPKGPFIVLLPAAISPMSTGAGGVMKRGRGGERDGEED